MGQSISTTQFFLYGKRHFTQTGYMKHVKSYYPEKAPQQSAAIPWGHPDSDGVTMMKEGEQQESTPKVVVITGANSGLGKEVATYAAAKGAKVYMLCRNLERANKAKEDIVQQIKTYLTASSSSSQTVTETPTNIVQEVEQHIHVLVVDVGEMAQVRNVVHELQSRESKIDVLVCNAGVLLNERQETSEGYEVTLASHLLGGTFLLSQLLRPQLEAAKGRAIFVTSGGMYNCKVPSWDIMTSLCTPNAGTSPRPYDGNMAYAYAKRAQVLLAERWAKQYPSIQWVTVHPGWADTPAVEEAYGDMKSYLNPMRTPWQGAEGVAWLMATDQSNIESGALYLDRKPQVKHLAGPFFTEGTFTKNTESEVDELIENLKKAAGLD